MEEITVYSQSDREMAQRLFEKAIEILKIPNEPTEEEVRRALDENGVFDLRKVPKFMVSKWGGTKCFNLVYFYDGIATVHAYYHPAVAILSCIDSARSHLSNEFPMASAEEIERWTEMEAFNMALSLISRVYRRMDLAMQNFTDEVIRFWRIERLKWDRGWNIEHGIKTPTVREKALFREIRQNT